MAATRRRNLLAAITARLEAITIDGGFETDAGREIFLGQDADLGDNDPDAVLAVSFGEERPTSSQVKLCYDLPISIKAVVKANLDDPWMTIEDMIGDIKKAMELEDRTLGGLVNRNANHGILRGPVTALQRETGSSTVGAEVQYIAPLVEPWGAP